MVTFGRAQSKGGRALAGLSKLARSMSLSEAEDAAFKPYKRHAVAFRRSQVQALANTVGGGVCGAAPSSMVESAAFQLAASRFLFDTAHGDAKKLKLASQMANDSRQNLLAAHELCARSDRILVDPEALARLKAKPPASELDTAFGGPPAPLLAAPGTNPEPT